MRPKKLTKIGKRPLRFIKKQQQTKGQIPGTLVFVGEMKQEHVRMRVIAYDEDRIEEKEVDSVAEVREMIGKWKIVWFNIDGLHDLERMNEIGNEFGFHPLMLEDVVHTGQRPKIEHIDENTFFQIKMMRLDEQKMMLHAEQLSIIQGSNFLITFQEKEGDVFEPIRERLRTKAGRIRTAGIGYLSYCLLDSVVDNYLYIMENLGEKIEELEEEILKQPRSDTLEKINAYKIELNYFRKAIRPAREAIHNWGKSEAHPLGKKLIPFVNDLKDLVSRAHDSVESYSNMLSEQLTIYNTNVSNRMNEIMKVLTIFAAIFIPLTFIAGIYGMNFNPETSPYNMPELNMPFGYVGALILMGICAIALMIFFRVKKWI